MRRTLLFLCILLSLLTVCCLAAPSSAQAETQSIFGSNNASSLLSNADIRLSSAVSLYLDTDKTIRSISGSYNLTISGPGTLTISGASGHSVSVSTLTLTGGTVRILAGDKGDGVHTENTITLSGGALSISNAECALYSGGGSIVLGGTSVTILNSEYGAWVEQGNFISQGGTWEGSCLKYSIYCVNGYIQLNGGSLRTVSHTLLYYALVAGSGISVNGASLEAEGSGGVTTSGGNIQFSAGTSVITSRECQGVYAQTGNIHVSGGSVTVASPDASGAVDCYAFHAQKGSVIFSGGTTTLTGYHCVRSGGHDIRLEGDLVYFAYPEHAVCGYYSVEYSSTNPAPASRVVVKERTYADLGLTLSILTPNPDGSSYEGDLLTADYSTLRLPQDSTLSWEGRVKGGTRFAPLNHHGDSYTPDAGSADIYDALRVTVSSPYYADTVTSPPVSLLPRPTHTLTFDVSGGSSLSPQQVPHRTIPVRPENPVKAGYTFDGWYRTYVRDENGKIVYRDPFDFTEPMTASVTIHAKWNPSTHTVTFYSMGGSDVPQALVEHGGLIPVSAVPTKASCDFDGWYRNAVRNGSEIVYSNPFSFRAPVTEDMNLYARWTAAETLTVTFDTGDGSEVPAQYVARGKTAQAPAVPTRAGYAFDGWYRTVTRTGRTVVYSDPYDFDTPVTQDITLYAKWASATHTIALNSHGGSAVPSITVAHNAIPDAPADPVWEGYTFDGWYQLVSTASDGSLIYRGQYSFNSPVTQNMTLHAKWKTAVMTVDFDAVGGSAVASQSVTYGSPASEPADPVREGYAFRGWYTSRVMSGRDFIYSGLYDFSQGVTKNLMLYAKWESLTRTVAFRSMGGSDVPSQQVTYGGQALPPEPPTRDGYLFVGWYRSATTSSDGTVIYRLAYDFEAPVTANLTLYARWSLPDMTRCLRLPRNLSRIESGAFAGMRDVTVIVPHTVESIAPDAFDGMVTICGYSGSAAEAFARDKGFPFVTITSDDYGLEP